MVDRLQRVVINGTTSEWKLVTSGIPQGSVLGPLLFVLFINDLSDNIIHHIKLYADDSKIIAIIESDADAENLQADIDKAVEWSNTWCMPFNEKKCTVMHIGRPNNKSSHIYTMTKIDGSRRQLEVSKVERDLGVLVSDDLKVRAQVVSASSTANRTLGRLKKAFRSRSFNLWRMLYITYIRPQLEFAVQAWSPHLKADIAIIEQVQHCATKSISAIKHVVYETRLKRLRLTTLEDRRVREDIIEKFKITNKIDEINFYVPQKQSASQSMYNMRGHSRRRSQHVQGCKERHNFFSNRVVTPWNLLSQNTIDASSSSLDVFKNRMSA